MNILKHITETLSNIISPAYCECCKDFLMQRDIFCKNCFNKIKPIVSIKLGINSKYSMNVFAISNYDFPIKSLILAKASSNILATKYLGKLIYEISNFKNMECDYLVPIPLHWIRYAKRGYNQTEVIAEILSKSKGVSIANILMRNKNTAYQSSLSVQKKFENVNKVFTLKSPNLSLYNDKNLILIDDLLTSGATLLAAAKELTKLKPKSINAIVACRVT